MTIGGVGNGGGLVVKVFLGIGQGDRNRRHQDDHRQYIVFLLILLPPFSFFPLCGGVSHKFMIQ